MAEETKKREVLLDVNGLCVTLFTEDGALPAIKDLSFKMCRGETFAVVGESGCGKSMMALSIMGLIPQPPAKIVAGSIEFDGTDLTKLSRDQLRDYRGNKISMIFQEPMTSLNPVYRVGDQIVEAIRIHTDLDKKAAWERAVEALRVVGIPSPEDRAHDYPHQMSGGMRQRVMIAMALSCNPRLLIADEPTTALDVTIQAQILDLIYKLREEYNMGVLLITHDLGVVSEVADRVVVMYCGQVVEQSPVEQLFEKPLHPYTLGLLNSIPRLENDDNEHLYMIRGQVPNPLSMPKGCPFSDRCDRCMDVCRERRPHLISVPGHPDRSVRCFLFEKEGE